MSIVFQYVWRLAVAVVRCVCQCLLIWGSCIFLGNSARGISAVVDESRRSKTPTTSTSVMTTTAVGSGNTAKTRQPQKQLLQGFYLLQQTYQCCKCYENTRNTFCKNEVSVKLLVSLLHLNLIRMKDLPPELYCHLFWVAWHRRSLSGLYKQVNAYLLVRYRYHNDIVLLSYWNCNSDINPSLAQTAPHCNATQRKEVCMSLENSVYWLAKQNKYDKTLNLIPVI